MIDVLFTPAEFAKLPARDLSRATCVVFDVLRATTTMITALANGASAIIPVAEIAEALALRSARPDLLLAGERQGLRLRAGQTGGVDFDLGNSPREFTPALVSGRAIAITTTNGTRALRACAAARTLLPGSFHNLGALAGWILRHPCPELLLVCSGTGEEAAYEDTLAAGALLARLGLDSTAVGAEGMARSGPAASWPAVSDGALMALRLWEQARKAFPEAAFVSRNARRLLAIPELADDVPFCLQLDTLQLVAVMSSEGVVKAD